MKRIIIHWTGGVYSPNKLELDHYHYLVGYQKIRKEKGIIYKGTCKPEDNLDCTSGRQYAAHTGGGNTGSIGVSVCAMYGYKDRNHMGEYPIKPIQMEVLYELCAKLCKTYKIPIEKKTVMTHYEFGIENPFTQSRGKPDINYLPTNPSLKEKEIGDFIRNKIKWYFSKTL